jgi:6-pyruvoyltetrahydropterin/6-carboxytetrahydropterin synthase
VVYRICKAFEIETGHMLSKHPGRCRYPHGHSRRVEVVLSAAELDPNDMVCDFKAVKLAVRDLIDAWDHALSLNSEDPALETLATRPELRGRLIVFHRQDPTTEVLAKHVFDYLKDRIASGHEVKDAQGIGYRLPSHLVLERVRVGETSTSWAEYGVL